MIDYTKEGRIAIFTINGHESIGALSVISPQRSSSSRPRGSFRYLYGNHSSMCIACKQNEEMVLINTPTPMGKAIRLALVVEKERTGDRRAEYPIRSQHFYPKPVDIDLADKYSWVPHNPRASPASFIHTCGGKIILE